MLNGKKTYIIVILMILTGLLTTSEFLDGNTYAVIMSILAPSSIATLRMGIKSNEKPKE